MIDIGFTGTQEGMTVLQKNRVRGLLRDLNPRQVRHGMCIGSDHTFHVISRQQGLYIIGHPGVAKNGTALKRADCDVDEIEPELPYLERNVEIAKSCNILVATPKEFSEQRRSGTWYTIRRAVNLNRTIFVVYPDGNVHS